MTVKEKLREWAGMKELYNKPEKPRIVTGYSCAADLPKKLEQLLRKVYARGVASYATLPEYEILKALEEKDE